MFRTGVKRIMNRGKSSAKGERTVYKVSDREGHEFALKLLRRDSWAGKAEAVSARVEFLQTASHPHIIRVLDHGLFGK